MLFGFVAMIMQSMLLLHSLNLKLKLKKSNEKIKILIGLVMQKLHVKVQTFEYILNVDSELRRCSSEKKQKSLGFLMNIILEILGWTVCLLTYGDMIMKSSDMVEMVFEDREDKVDFGCWVNQN